MYSPSLKPLTTRLMVDPSPATPTRLSRPPMVSALTTPALQFWPSTTALIFTGPCWTPEGVSLSFLQLQTVSREIEKSEKSRNFSEVFIFYTFCFFEQLFEKQKRPGRKLFPEFG